MPIYEYECPSCGVVEVMQGIKDPPLTKCPSCHKRKVKKLISNTSFQLKGTGWYVTDYARGKGNGGNGKGRGHEADKTSSAPEKKAPASEPAKKDSSDKQASSSQSKT